MPKIKTFSILSFAIAGFLLLAGPAGAVLCGDHVNLEKGISCGFNFVCGDDCYETLPTCETENSGLNCDSCQCICDSGYTKCGGGAFNPNCVEMAPIDSVCDPLNRISNYCAGDCGDCDPNWHDCDGNPDDCETNFADSQIGTECDLGGGITGFYDSCGNCLPEQPYLPREGDIANPGQPYDIVSDQNLVFIDKPSAGDIFNFQINGEDRFILNSAGHMMFGYVAGDDAKGVTLDSGNLIYGNITDNTGNLMLFNKQGSEVFKITNDGSLYPGQLCLLAEEGGTDYACYDYWPGLEGGEGLGDITAVLPGVNITCGEEGCGQTGDVTVSVVDHPSFTGLDITGQVFNGLNEELYINGNGDVQIKIDSDGGGDNKFFINNDEDSSVFWVDEFGNVWAANDITAEGDIITNGDLIINEGGAFNFDGDTINNWEEFSQKISTEMDIDKCSGPKYTGLSGSFVNGDRGGYAAADDECGPDEYVCTVEDMLRSVSCGVDIPDSGEAWVNGGPPGYRAPSNDCQGWDDGSPSSLGRMWMFGQNKGVLTNCDMTIRYACCK